MTLEICCMEYYQTSEGLLITGEDNKGEGYVEKDVEDVMDVIDSDIGYNIYGDESRLIFMKGHTRIVDIVYETDSVLYTSRYNHDGEKEPTDIFWEKVVDIHKETTDLAVYLDNAKEHGLYEYMPDIQDYSYSINEHLVMSSEEREILEHIFRGLLWYKVNNDLDVDTFHQEVPLLYTLIYDAIEMVESN